MPDLFHTLFVFLCMAVVGMAIGVCFGELATICAFFGGLFLGYGVLRLFERAIAKKREYRPAVAEILKKAEEAQN